MSIIHPLQPLRNMRVPTLESPSPPSARPMLARDADATYWMARYVERAEHVARLLLVNGESLVSVGDVAGSLLERYWPSVLEIMQCEPLPGLEDVDSQAISLPITEYMTFDEQNPNSLIRCLTRARENARGIREVITSEMWQQLNMLYWSMRSDDALGAFREAPHQLYQRIITGSMLFQGLTDQTLLHGQRWFFAQLGKCFERITVTCRLLKNRFEMLGDSADAGPETPLWNIHWSSVLRSCGSIEGYRRVYLGDLNLAHIAQFLILDPDFPRSVRYCMRRAHEAIAAIRVGVRPNTIDPTERILGRLDARLEYAEPADLLSAGLSLFADEVLSSTAEAAVAVQRSFFLY